MKDNQKKWSRFQVQLLIFAFLFLSLSACYVNRSRENSVAENTEQNKNAGDVKKEKPKIGSKTKPENAVTDDEDADENTEENTEENADENVEENVEENADEEYDLTKQVCKRYDSCGCQSYEKCMEDAKIMNFDDEVLSCVLKSSCKSLCAGKPDGCAGAERSPKTNAPKQSACPQIRCSKNSDCPGDCYGGCKNGICLLF